MSLADWRNSGFPEPSELGVYPVLGDGTPDPLRFFDGSIVSNASEWTNRREEIVEAFKFYQYGEGPIPPPVSSTIGYDAMEWGGLGRLREVTLSLGTTGLSITALLATPSTAGPHPIFVVMTHLALASNLPPESGYPGAGGSGDYGTSAGDDVDWESILERGYAVLLFREYDLVDSDTNGALFSYYQQASNGGPYSWGYVRAAAWLASRWLDYAETDSLIDATHAIVAGHSRRGKAALCAAMYDERWAAPVVLGAGTGGVGLWRRLGFSPHENVAKYKSTLPRQFFRFRLYDFENIEARMPFDGNHAAAAIAPRPLLVGQVTEDAYSHYMQELLSLRSAEAAYEILGKTSDLPESIPSTPHLHLGPISFFVRSGTHSFNWNDWPAILDFAESQVTSIAPSDPDPPPTSGYLTFHPAPSEPLTFYAAGAFDEPEAPNAAPTVTLTPASQTALSLSLSEVDGATGYRYRVGTSGSWTDLGTNRTAQITGLTPGTSYTVQARAYNEAGDGPIGSATASTLEPEVNAPPVFQTSPPTSVRAGQTYVYNGVVTDADGDPITITLEEGPDWLELTDHGDGTFTLEGTAPNE